MFGNILIDKFQCYMSVNPNDKEKTKQLKLYIEGILAEHYAQNAFYVDISRDYARLTFGFTPTRYYKNIADINKYTDTNLIMPLERELLELFTRLFDNKLFFEQVNYCKITKLDLTKNFLMKNLVMEYICKLINRVYKDRYKAILHSSEEYNKTLSITTLASNAEKSDKVGDREIIFYNKVIELKNRGISTVYLKEPLSADEKTLIPSGMYNDKLQILNISSLNILRVELQYGSSNKLSAFSKFLGFEDSQKGLYFKDFFGLLLNGELYEKLNDYYTKTLIDIMLLNEVPSESNLNVYQKIIQEYWDDVWELDINSAFKNNGLSSKYRKNMIKIQSTVKNPLIEELKANIIGLN